MRTFILSIAMLTLHLNSVSGQARHRVAGADITIPPLVLIDSFKTDMNSLVCNPNKIESIDVIKDSAALSQYGQAGKYGVVLIHPKSGVSFLRINKILDKYNIAKQDRTLRICINKTLIKEPGLILIEKSELVNVEITTDRHWVNMEDANTGEKFLNIITDTKDKNNL